MCNLFQINRAILVILSFLALTGCAQPTNLESQKMRERSYQNCFLLKPLTRNLYYVPPTNVEYPVVSIDSAWSTGKTPKEAKLDTAVSYLLSFEHQARIFYNYDCFRKLPDPDSADVMGVFMQSSDVTRTYGTKKLSFDTSYKIEIAHLGKAQVWIYNINSAANNAPHCMFLLLKETDHKYGADVPGIVLYCDDVRWLASGTGQKTLVCIDRWNEDLTMEMLMIFDGLQFIPVAHYRQRE